MMNMLSKGKCNSKSKEEDSNFLKIQTCVLKVNIHCDGCKRKVKKLLQKIDGVYTVTVDVEQKKVSVSGNVDPNTLIRKLVKNGKHAELLSPKLSGGGRNNHFQKQLQVDNAAKAGQKGGGDKKQVPVMKHLQPQQTKGFNLKMPAFMKNPNSVKFDVPEDDEDVWSDFDDGDVLDELDELGGGFDDDFEVDLKQMKNFKPMKGDGEQKKGAAANYVNKMMPPLQRDGGAFPAGMNMMPPQRSGGNGNGGSGNVSMNPVMNHTKKGDGNGQKKGVLVGGKKGGDVGCKKSGKKSGGGTGGGKEGKGDKGGGGGGGNKNPNAGTPFQMSVGGGGVGGPFQNPSGMNMMPPQRCANGNGAGGGGNISMHPAMTHIRNGGPMSGQPPELFSGSGNPYHQQQYLAAMMQQQQQQQQQQRMMMNGGGGGSMAYSRAPPPVAAAVNYMNPAPDFTHVFSDENTNSCSIM